MRFKRPQVRYSETPEPVTPYQVAAQVWDQRIGSARLQAKNWRQMAFRCLPPALLISVFADVPREYQGSRYLPGAAAA